MSLEKQQWHLGKEVPVATILMLLIQTAGALWWAASITAELRHVKETQNNLIVAQALVDRRQDEEAKRAEDRLTISLEKLNLKLDRVLERRDRH